MNNFISIATVFALLFWGGAVMMSPMMMAAKDFRDSLSSLLTAIVILGFPVILFGIFKLVGFRFFGLNVTGWLIGFSIVCALIFLAYGIPGLLFNMNKGIPNTGYFVNESSVYLDGDKLKEADPKTFQVQEIDSFYAKDQNFVFYYGKKIKEAHPLSFVPVPNAKNDSLYGIGTPIFWKDHSHVYYNGVTIAKADPNTFQHIQSIYAKDRERIYYQTEALEGANPNTYRFLNENIAIDDSSVFVLTKRSKIPVDLNSFKVVENENEAFCVDSENVYLVFYQREEPLEKVEGADIATFRTLERNYASDKDHVYFFGNYKGDQELRLIKLEGANPKKFVIGYNDATKSEATDGTHYYMDGALVKK